MTTEFDHLPRPGKAPCGTCPYRQDVPAGIWHESEYAKLPTYDGGTMEQMEKEAYGLFYCHQNDGHLCSGWAACHDMDHLLAARMNPVHPDTYDYVSPVPLFASGAEAAAHGMSGIEDPSPAALASIEKLVQQRQRKA